MQKQYVDATTETLPTDMQAYIDYVEQAKNRFMQLINADENELDISLEYRRIFRQKVVEWDKLVSSLTLFTPAVAQHKLKTESVKYHDYFENTYLSMMFTIS